MNEYNMMWVDHKKKKTIVKLGEKKAQKSHVFGIVGMFDEFQMSLKWIKDALLYDSTRSLLFNCSKNLVDL